MISRKEKSKFLPILPIHCDIVGKIFYDFLPPFMSLPQISNSDPEHVSFRLQDSVRCKRTISHLGPSEGKAGLMLSFGM